MALSTVTLKWDVTDLVQSGVQAVLSIIPTALLSDTAGHALVAAAPRRVQFAGGTGQLTGIVANDSGVLPPNAGYLISVATAGGAVLVPQFQTVLNYADADGGVLWLDQLATVPVVATGQQYVPLPGNAPSEGNVLEVLTVSPLTVGWQASSGEDKNFSQDFGATDTVGVEHNLGKYPAVTVFDSAGDQCEGAVEYADLNNLTVSFSAPFSGTVTCN